MKRVSLIVLFFSVFVGESNGQLAVWNPNWSLITTPTGAPSPLAATSLGTNISAAAMSRNSLGGVSSINRYNSDSWTDPDAYLVITVTPASGYVLDLAGQTVVINMGSSNTGPNGYFLFSSVDNYGISLGSLTTTTAAPSNSPNTINIPNLPAYNNLTSITFHLTGNHSGVGANPTPTAAAPAGTGGPSYVQVNGNTSVAPPNITNNPLTASTTYGTSFTYQINATSPTAITYNVANPSAGLSVSVNASGLVTATVTSSLIPASGYSFDISATNGGGTTTKTITLTVTQRPITLTATGPSMTYGNPLSTITGSSSFSLTSGGYAFTESVTAVTLTPDASAQSATLPAGSAYSVEPSAATGINGFISTNYNITYANYIGAVSKKALSITANKVYKSQGTGLSTVANNTDFTITGLENAQTVGSVTMSYGSGGAAGAGVGIYSGANGATPSLAVGGTFNINNYTVSYFPGDIEVVAGAIPVITSSGTPAALNTITGTFSTATSFNVAGTNMLAGILVTPPVSFEVSLAVGGPYAATVTVGAAGTISSTPVYIRLKATTLPGTYSGFIVCSSTSASNENVTMPASVVSAIAPGIQASNITFPSITSITFTVNWTNGNGGRRVVFIKDGTGIASTPADGSQYFADPNFGTGEELTPGNGFYCIYDGTGNSVNITGLTPGTTYTVEVFEYNSDDNTAPTESFIKYNIATNATNPVNQATASPTIIVSPATLTGFAYYENYGPSSSLNYTLSATNLTAATGSITVGGTTNYEFSNDNVNFSSSLSVNYTGYNLTATTIYVRLKLGLTVGAYNGQDITNSGGGATTQNVTCNGNVITAPAASPILAWSFAGNNSTTNPYIGYSSGTPVSGISSTGITRGAGIAAIALNNTFGGSSYTNASAATAITGGDYFTFDLTTDATHTASLFSIAGYNIRKSATGPTTLQWQYKVGAGSFIDVPGGGPITIVNLVTATAISLGAISALQNLPPATTVTFRLILYGGTNSGGTGYLNITGGANDIAILGTVESYCSGADAIEFVSPPSDVIQDVVMNSVTVRAYCTSNGATDKAYAKTVTIASAAAPLYVCGLTGTLSQTFFNGVATYSNIKITRSAQPGVKLIASTSAPVPILSITTADASNAATFNVIAPSGAPPTTTTIASDDFEAAATWTRTIGSPTYTGSGTGTDNTTVKTLSGNKTLVKSFSVDNNSTAGSNKSSSTVVTFANQVIASTVDYATFSFQLASLGDPSSPNGSGAFSGEGNDNNEDMYIEISLDGGTSWNKTLTFKGHDNYVFPFSGSVATATALAYNANVVYNGVTTLSYFKVTLPTGSTQFRFRMTATNNRINENWALDNIKLESTTISTGTQSPLPSVDPNSVTTCPNTNTTISVVTNNTQGAVTYAWTPSGGSIVGSATVSNPTATITGPGSGTFTAAITDADGCKASGVVTVAVPGGTSGTWTGANNSDWFQCGNWGGGVVPDNTVDVTIASTATNAADIDPLSTYATAFSGIARTKNITINGKALTTQLNANLNVAANLSITNTAGSLLNMTNGGQVDLFASWTNTMGATGFTAGAGTINYAGSVAQTVAPENYKNLTISLNGTRTVTLSSSGTIGVDSIFNPAASTTTYVVTNSTVDFGGSNLPQTIPAFTFYNVGFKNGGTKTLGGSIFVQKTLTMGASTTFALSSSNVTLRSVSGLTANVTTVPASATIDQSGTGRFVIERFVNAVRGWRFLTAPITTAQTIRSAWMEGATPATLPASNPNPAAPYGTHISGPSPAANGFDYTPRNNYSIKYYDPSSATGAFIGAANTGLSIISEPAWMLFVRGDRSYPILTTTQYVTPQNATLRTTGRINVGDMPTQNIPVTASGYTVVANPYPSAINFSTVDKSPAAAANDIYSIWDPELNTNGGWITMERFGVPGPDAYDPSVIPGSSIDYTDGRIESGVAVLVAKANLNSVTIKESDKSDNSSLFFRPQQPVAVRRSSLRATLYAKNDDGTRSVVDGSLQLFDRSYSNSIDGADARKPENVNEGWGIKAGDEVLAIEKRDLPVVSDTIFYNMTRLNVKNYILEFKADNISRNNMVGYIVDNYLGSFKKLNMQGTTQVGFNVINEPGAYAKDRFRIVFRRQVNFTNIKATPSNADIAVDWKVSEVDDVAHYEVERSTDNTNFKAIGTVYTNSKIQASGYSLLDKDAAPGVYYYRIKGVGETGAAAYSDIAKVTVIRNDVPMLVFPNPVTGNTINLQLNSQPKGYYSVKLLNGYGQMVTVKLINHAGGTATQVIRPGSKLAAGTYQLEVTGPDKKETSLRVVVVQDK